MCTAFLFVSISVFFCWSVGYRFSLVFFFVLFIRCILSSYISVCLSVVPYPLGKDSILLIGWAGWLITYAWTLECVLFSVEKEKLCNYNRNHPFCETWRFTFLGYWNYWVQVSGVPIAIWTWDFLRDSSFFDGKYEGDSVCYTICTRRWRIIISLKFLENLCPFFFFNEVICKAEI